MLTENYLGLHLSIKY